MITNPIADPAGRWWIRDTDNPLAIEDDAPGPDYVGPYRTRTQAREARAGLIAFYRDHADKKDRPR